MQNKRPGTEENRSVPGFLLFCAFFIPQAQHGDVVELYGAFRVFVNLLPQTMQQVFRRCIRIPVQGLEDPGGAEHLFAGIDGFRNAVRIDKQPVSRMQYEGVFLERDILISATAGLCL